MVSVLVDSPAFSDCAARLREGKFLFAAHGYYTDSCDALASILEEVILPSHCVFTFFIAGDEAACRRGSGQHHRSAQYGKRSVTDGFDRFTFRFIVYRPNRFRRGVLRRLLRGRERIFVLDKVEAYTEYNVCNSRIADILKKIAPRKNKRQRKIKTQFCKTDASELRRIRCTCGPVTAMRSKWVNSGADRPVF